MGSSEIISTAKITALITFIGATIILLVFYLTNNTGFGFLGLMYSAIMIIINLVVSVRFLFQYHKLKIGRNAILKALGIMLLNITVLIVFSWVSIALSNVVRITFINSTTVALSDIQIAGCEEKVIQKLTPGQSKTVRISIPHDCGVWILYSLNGLTKQEDVTGYVTNDGGYSMTFRIGTNQKPYDQDL